MLHVHFRNAEFWEVSAEFIEEFGNLYDQMFHLCLYSLNKEGRICMTTVEIINLTISILSLIATIAISFVIYFLEKKNSKLANKKKIEDEARKFIIENADERDYLHWATIAAGCFPQNKHIRKIYNNFSLLDKDVQKEVLKQTKNDTELIDGSDWIDNKIKLVQTAIKELDIGDDFLYDGGKYFHGLYKAKGKEYDITPYYEHDLYDNVFKFSKMFEKHKGKIIFSRYLDYYLYCKYEKTELFSTEWIKPNDYMIEMEKIKTVEDETYVYFWISHIVEKTIQFSIKYLEYKQKEHIDTDAQSKTFEDRYFEVLYELYYWDKKE